MQSVSRGPRDAKEIRHETGKWFGVETVGARDDGSTGARLDGWLRHGQARAFGCRYTGQHAGRQHPVHHAEAADHGLERGRGFRWNSDPRGRLRIRGQVSGTPRHGRHDLPARVDHQAVHGYGGHAAGGVRSGRPRLAGIPVPAADGGLRRFRDRADRAATAHAPRGPHGQHHGRIRAEGTRPDGLPRRPAPRREPAPHECARHGVRVLQRRLQRARLPGGGGGRRRLRGLRDAPHPRAARHVADALLHLAGRRRGCCHGVRRQDAGAGLPDARHPRRRTPLDGRGHGALHGLRVRPGPQRRARSGRVRGDGQPAERRCRVGRQFLDRTRVLADRAFRHRWHVREPRRRHPAIPYGARDDPRTSNRRLPRRELLARSPGAHPARRGSRPRGVRRAVGEADRRSTALAEGPARP